jgi:hypothetical protein
MTSDQKRILNRELALKYELGLINSRRKFFKRDPLTVENDKAAIRRCLVALLENLERSDSRYAVRAMFSALDHLDRLIELEGV